MMTWYNINMKKEEILKALNWRYAVKIFDKDKKISEEDLNTILEAGILSPSSLGLEPWKFIVVKNPETRAKLFEISNQPKVTDASHLIVLTYKKNLKSVTMLAVGYRGLDPQAEKPKIRKDFSDAVEFI